MALGPESAAALMLALRASRSVADVLSKQKMEIKLQYAEKLANALAEGSSGYLVVKILSGLLKKSF